MSDNYIDWSIAIARYFTRNVPLGGEVYLSVDSDTLADIGPLVFGEQLINWEEHFLNAVRNYVFENDKYQAKKLENRWIQLQKDRSIVCPRAVGFLAALVLAANRMQRDDQVTENAYFIRLCSVLAREAKADGHPKQFKSTSTEILWQQWNEWLESKGLTPTAFPGQGSHRYINYPISQALLRQGDRARLHREFVQLIQAGNLRRNWSAERLGYWLNSSRRVGPKVKVILEQPDSPRYRALLDAIYDIYLSLGKPGSTGPLGSTGQLTLATALRVHNLSAGLYRYEKASTETVSYYPYPRQPSRAYNPPHLKLKKPPYELKQERVGWYAPLPIALSDPGQSQEWLFDQAQGVERLIFPGAEFWILVRDPEQPHSRHWASWRRPEPGEHFMLLCKEKYRAEMERLRDLKLIAWDECFEVPELTGNWYEYEGCMLTNLDWEGVFATEGDLFEALYPHVQIGIQISGGLKSPDGVGWMVTHPPEIKVTGVQTDLNIRIYHYQETGFGLNKRQLYERRLPTGQAESLQVKLPGRYLLEADHPRLHYSARRQLLLHDWESLKPAEPSSASCYSALSENTYMQGAWIDTWE